MKKYELVDEPGTSLKRVVALRDIPRFHVKKGDKGGLITDEKNLSQEGDAWVFGNALVSGDAQVSDDAKVTGNAWVSGDARVFGNVTKVTKK